MSTTAAATPRNWLASILSLTTPPLALYLALAAAVALRGEDLADVGVPMHENPGLGLVGGLGAYFVVGITGLLVARRAGAARELIDGVVLLGMAGAIALAVVLRWVVA